MELMKKIWHWLRCEDENGNSTYDGNPLEALPFKCSKLIDKFPIHGKIGKEDILQLSHRLDNGGYETCYVTVKQLKDAILEMA